MWTRWNTPDAELLAKIGPAKSRRAVPWSTLTPEQKDFQRTKMAIHAAMITPHGPRDRPGPGAGAMPWAPSNDTVVLFLSDNGASSEQ